MIFIECQASFFFSYSSVPFYVTLILNLKETNISLISVDFEEKMENNRKKSFLGHILYIGS